MRDRVAEMLARHLRVSVSYILGWRVEAGRSGHRLRPLGLGAIGVMGQVSVRLVVDVAYDRSSVLSPQDLLDIRPGFYLQELNLGDCEVQAVFDLLHCSATQHLFKALYQTMTVRGPQTKRQKRRRK